MTMPGLPLKPASEGISVNSKWRDRRSELGMRILASEEQSELIVNKSKFIGYSVIANSREDFLG